MIARLTIVSAALMALTCLLSPAPASAQIYYFQCVDERGQRCPDPPPPVSGGRARRELAVHDANVQATDRVIDRHSGQFTIVRRPWRDGEFCSSAVERRRYFAVERDGERREQLSENTLYVHARLSEAQCRAVRNVFDRNSASEAPFATDVAQLRCTDPTPTACFNALARLQTFAGSRESWANVFFEWRGRYLQWRAEAGDHRQEHFDHLFDEYISRRSPIIDLGVDTPGLDCVRAIMAFEVATGADGSIAMCQAHGFDAETTYLSLNEPLHD